MGGPFCKALPLPELSSSLAPFLRAPRPRKCGAPDVALLAPKVARSTATDRKEPGARGQRSPEAASTERSAGCARDTKARLHSAGRLAGDHCKRTPAAPADFPEPPSPTPPPLQVKPGPSPRLALGDERRPRTRLLLFRRHRQRRTQWRRPFSGPAPKPRTGLPRARFARSSVPQRRLASTPPFPASRRRTDDQLNPPGPTQGPSPAPLSLPTPGATPETPQACDPRIARTDHPRPLSVGPNGRLRPRSVERLEERAGGNHWDRRRAGPPQPRP